jgi:hypothetical protein
MKYLNSNLEDFFFKSAKIAVTGQPSGRREDHETQYPHEQEQACKGLKHPGRGGGFGTERIAYIERAKGIWGPNRC